MTTDSTMVPAIASPSEPVVRRAAGAQATAVAAQTLGALQLLLLLHEGAGRSSDAYFVIFAAGQLVVNIWVLGVLYPRQLADPTLPWRGRTATASATATACVLTAAAYLLIVGYPVWIVLPIAVLLAAAAAASAAANCQAAVLACGGAPHPLAGVTLLPNLLACVGLLLPISDGSPVLRMCVGLVIGNLALLPLQAARVRATLASRPTGLATAAGAPRWLLYGSVIGNLAPLILQASLASLPGGRVTVFSAGSRLALAATSIGVSSILPLLVSWDRYEARTIRKLCRMTVALLPTGAAAAAVLGAHVGHGVVTPLVLVLFTCWALVAPTTPLLTQATIRNGDFTAFRTTGSLNLGLTLVGAVATVVTRRLDVAVATALAVQVVVTLALLRRLRWMPEIGWLAVAAATCVVVAARPILTPVAILVSWIQATRSLARLPS